MRIKSHSSSKMKMIYEYSLKMLEIRHENKRHIEIKALYLLQGSAILLTLFTIALANPDMRDRVPTVIIFIFFAFIGIAVSLLLISLDDRVRSWVFKKSKSTVGKEDSTSESKNAETGLYKMEPRGSKVLEKIDKKFLSEYDLTRIMIKNLSFSAESLFHLSEAKGKLFHWALKLFIGALIALVIAGILIA